jgi:LysR family transcriptional regulator, regulator for metE and metH
VAEEGEGLPIRTLRLGEHGINKSINLGVRRGEEDVAYIAGFLALAHEMGAAAGRQVRGGEHA